MKRPSVRVLNGRQLQFAAYETSVSYLLNTTDDNVVETPDETLTVSIYVPGMFPSYLGDLIASVSIEVGVETPVGTLFYARVTCVPSNRVNSG